MMGDVTVRIEWWSLVFVADCVIKEDVGKLGKGRHVKPYYLCNSVICIIHDSEKRYWNHRDA